MKKRIILGILFAVIILLLGFYFLFFSKDKKDENLTKKAESYDISNDSKISVEEKKDIEKPSENKKESGYFTSENYRVDDIQFGGSSPLLVYGNQNLSLDIYDIDSRVLSDPKKKEVNLLINWKTNKLAVSEIEYFPKKGGKHKFFKEKNFSFNHNAVISDLNTSTAYVYKIKCHDNWGKEKVSDSRVVYTGKGFASIFDVISEAFGDMFSWISK